MTHKVLKPFKIFDEATEEYVVFEESDSFDSKDVNMKANVKSLESSEFIVKKGTVAKKVKEDKQVAVSEEISKIDDKPRGRGRAKKA